MGTHRLRGPEHDLKFEALEAWKTKNHGLSVLPQASKKKLAHLFQFFFLHVHRLPPFNRLNNHELPLSRCILATEAPGCCKKKNTRLADAIFRGIPHD